MPLSSGSGWPARAGAVPNSCRTAAASACWRSSRKLAGMAEEVTSTSASPARAAIRVAAAWF
ncbi:hypothetical protein [Massilia sp. LC238]|uniref:hypothetical protein n=1 Tax=Massilia sp. LC238 TaxID=1502852 RepID=UPI00055F17BD|nr:hypothetical protein [Massilia sp. LC238]